MINITNKNGMSTGWLDSKPTIKQLERLNIEQLLLIARKRKGFKKLLIDFTNGIDLDKYL